MKSTIKRRSAFDREHYQINYSHVSPEISLILDHHQCGNSLYVKMETPIFREVIQ